MKKKQTKSTIKVYVDFQPRALEHINAKLAGIGGGGFHKDLRRPNRSERKVQLRKEGW